AKISRMVVGDPTISPGQTVYSLARGVAQDDHVEGLPLGTRGGLLFEHVFPLDAEYEFRINESGAGFGLRAVGGEDPTVVTLNGVQIAMLGREDRGRVTLPIAAGPQVIGVAKLPSAQERGVDDLYSWIAPSSGVTSVSIMGPLGASGPGDTPSRRKLFVCRPEVPEEEMDCAREILSTLATRAYRRPVTAEDPTVTTLLEFFE